MEPLRSSVQTELSSVLQPELGHADDAFPQHDNMARPQDRLDAALRAVMLRLMAQLLQGYRSCLTLVRIHPKPFITFHKAAFLGMRNLSQDCDFMAKFLECMFFSEFISSRGPPWRRCDIFDDLYANIGEQLAAEATDAGKTAGHIAELAKQIYDNEHYWSVHHANGHNFSERIPLPTEGHMMRVHQPIFPHLDEQLVDTIIQDGIQANKLRAEKAPATSSQNKLVPMGQRQQGSLVPGYSGTNVPNSARKLEVLRTCISNIFENKISDAKKTFPAVIRTLKLKVSLHFQLPCHQ